jgi:YspA, cpYpsA-related SLOG family
MRILITGDRHSHCPEPTANILRRLVDRYGNDLVVVHGAAPGVDQSFAEACGEVGIPAELHLANWDALGKAAGPKRNREMVELGANPCLAFHRTLAASKGTKDCVRQALAAGITAYQIGSEEAVPKRITLGDWRLASWV